MKCPSCNENTPLDKNYQMIKKLKNVDEMFDLLIFNSFIRGQFNQMIPVDESREIFEVIKTKLLSSKKGRE